MRSTVTAAVWAAALAVALHAVWAALPTGAFADGDHAVLTELLSRYVDEGRVDYLRLCEDERLDAYLERIAATDPETIVDVEARLAFWINAYNAYTLKIICDNYPVDSINDLHFGGLVIGTVLNKTIWDKKFVVVAGEKYSLNDVEHKIIRPVYDDPRTHYALVCAAKSCPPLRREAYVGDRLDEQLDDQGRIFFAEPDKNHFDREKKIAYLSKIMDWYKGDFGDNDEALLLSITRHLPPALAEDIRSNPGAWDIKHTDYDWSLND